MSALSCWVTCGITRHALPRCSAVLRRMLLIGLRSTSPHFVKSGSGRRARRRRGAAAAGERRLRRTAARLRRRCGRPDRCPAPAGSRRRARAPAGAPTEPRAAPGRLGASPRAELRAPRLMSTTSPRFFGAGGGARLGVACLFGIVGLGDLDRPARLRPCRARRRPPSRLPPGLRLARRRLGSSDDRAGLCRRFRRLLAAAAGFGLRASRAFGASAFLPGGPGAVVHGQDDLADLDLVARLDPDFADRCRRRGRHFDGRLVGLELEDRLVLRDRVAGA